MSSLKVFIKCCYFQTVRNLQARVLREEWERREQLEKLQQEQQDLLEMEKMKRLEFERKQQENEHQLRGIENFIFMLKYELKNSSIALIYRCRNAITNAGS